MQLCRKCFSSLLVYNILILLLYFYHLWLEFNWADTMISVSGIFTAPRQNVSRKHAKIISIRSATEDWNQRKINSKAVREHEVQFHRCSKLLSPLASYIHYFCVHRAEAREDKQKIQKLRQNKWISWQDLKDFNLIITIFIWGRANRSARFILLSQLQLF